MTPAGSSGVPFMPRHHRGMSGMAQLPGTAFLSTDHFGPVPDECIDLFSPTEHGIGDDKPTYRYQRFAPDVSNVPQFRYDQTMERDWNLHYARWVIEDGQPELHVGEEFDWHAVSFWSYERLMRSTECCKGATPITDYRYRVNAEVIYISQDANLSAFIIDFGVRAECLAADLLPKGCTEGDYVSGEISLDLPLCGAPHAYDLSHRWRINEIHADMTPFVLSSVGRVCMRDTSQIYYQTVCGTDSVKARSYLLNCSLLTT
jgi:hypothetical protein